LLFPKYGPGKPGSPVRGLNLLAFSSAVGAVNSILVGIIIVCPLNMHKAISLEGK
jgi:hypothetical protein